MVNRTLVVKNKKDGSETKHKASVGLDSSTGGAPYTLHTETGELVINSEQELQLIYKVLHHSINKTQPWTSEPLPDDVEIYMEP